MRNSDRATRFGAAGFPVFKERFQLFDGHAAMIFTGVPPSHQRTVTFAQRAPREELAVELLQDLEPKVGRRPRCGLGFFLFGRLRYLFGGNWCGGFRRLFCLVLFCVLLCAGSACFAGLADFSFPAASFAIDLTLLSLDSKPTRDAAIK